MPVYVCVCEWKKGGGGITDCHLRQRGSECPGSHLSRIVDRASTSFTPLSLSTRSIAPYVLLTPSLAGRRRLANPWQITVQSTFCRMMPQTCHSLGPAKPAFSRKKLARYRLRIDEPCAVLAAGEEGATSASNTSPSRLPACCLPSPSPKQRSPLRDFPSFDDESLRRLPPVADSMAETRLVACDPG